MALRKFNVIYFFADRKPALYRGSSDVPGLNKTVTKKLGIWIYANVYDYQTKEFLEQIKP